MQIWLIYTIIVGLGSNISNFLLRVVLKDHQDATAHAWIVTTIRGVVFLLFCMVDFRLEFSTRSILTLGLLGVCETLALTFMMKMHANSELSLSTILTRTRLLWTPIFAFILYKEILHSIEYIGIIILFVGISMSSSRSSIKTDKGQWYALGFGLMSTIIALLLKSSYQFASPSVAIVFMSLIPTLLLPIIRPNLRNRIPDFIKTKLFLKLTSTIINSAYLYFYVLALHYGNASKVVALYQGMMIISIILGIVILKENQNLWRKVGGAILTIIGAIMLSFS